MRNCNYIDYGPNPLVANVEQLTLGNHNFRTSLWTGKDMQMTLMCIPVGGDIGLEVHPEIDQFIYIEQGCGCVKMGRCKEHLDLQSNICRGYGIFIPAGTWHNVCNSGSVPLKLYSLYAPPQHPRGTIHRTKPNPCAEYV